MQPEHLGIAGRMLQGIEASFAYMLRVRICTSTVAEALLCRLRTSKSYIHCTGMEYHYHHSKPFTANLRPPTAAHESSDRARRSNKPPGRVSGGDTRRFITTKNIL